MLPAGIDKSACQAQAAKQEQTEPDEHFVPFLSINPDVTLSNALSLGNSSGHLVSPDCWFRCQSFCATRSFALRARRFSTISASVGATGRRVKISTAFRAPHVHCGRRGGHWQRPESFKSVRLIIRSSSE